MNKLIKEVKKLKQSKVSKVVNKRLGEFRALGKKGNNEWFSELCFCILTANSKAITAIQIQKELGHKGFLHNPQLSISKTIRNNGHRFHNNKSRFIVGARKFSNIKDIVKSEEDPREWIVKNVKGIGWKESSHFLRNVGYANYAILDRHILNLMKENGYIKKIPKTLSKEKYFLIEKKFSSIATKLQMSLAELDLYMWYMKTSVILK